MDDFIATVVSLFVVLARLYWVLIFTVAIVVGAFFTLLYWLFESVFEHLREVWHYYRGTDVS